MCGRGATRKAIRSALLRLISSGFLERGRALPAGQCPYVITIRDYACLLVKPEAEGPRRALPAGPARASEGPGSGPQEADGRAPKEQGEHRKPGEPGGQVPLLPSPLAPARRAARKGAPSSVDPRHRPLQERLQAAFQELKGCAYGFQGGKDGKAVAELLRLSSGDLDEVERRWRRALGLGERWPGCSTLALLPGRWNELAGSAQQRRTVIAPAEEFAPGVRRGVLGDGAGPVGCGRMAITTPGAPEDFGEGGERLFFPLPLREVEAALGIAGMQADAADKPTLEALGALRVPGEEVRARAQRLLRQVPAARPADVLARWDELREVAHG